MNPAFDEVLTAGSEAMLSAFDTTALRLGTTSQNIEKDFWVCWTLDALFNGPKEGGPRLLFKGGTSLSKGFGLIIRFSEDIDVTVFRDDIGEPTTIEELHALSGNKRRARLDAIKDACQAYINGPLRAALTLILQDRLRAAGLDAGAARVEADDADPDGQTLLIWYPRRRRGRIMCGRRSRSSRARNPRSTRTAKCRSNPMLTMICRRST